MEYECGLWLEALTLAYPQRVRLECSIASSMSTAISSSTGSPLARYTYIRLSISSARIRQCTRIYSLVASLARYTYIWSSQQCTRTRSLPNSLHTHDLKLDYTTKLRSLNSHLAAAGMTLYQLVFQLLQCCRILARSQTASTPGDSCAVSSSPSPSDP